MVCQLGMSDAVGPMAIGDQSQEVFIGREWVTNRDHSEATAQLVDAEVKRIIDASMHTALALLRENIELLHRMAEALLDRETLTGEEVDLIMKGESLPPLGEEEARRMEERRLAAAEARGNGSGSSPSPDGRSVRMQDVADGGPANGPGVTPAADAPKKAAPSPASREGFSPLKESVPASREKSPSPASVPQEKSPSPKTPSPVSPEEPSPPDSPARVKPARSPLGAALSREKMADAAAQTSEQAGGTPAEDKPDTTPKADS